MQWNLIKVIIHLVIRNKQDFNQAIKKPCFLRDSMIIKEITGLGII
jgi:hypothetical protein